MSAAGLLAHLANGLASASSLFLLSAGLSLIFGVSRIVNFAHGSLYMLGLYLAYSFVGAFGETVVGFWSGIVLAAIAVAAIGALVEALVLRRIYRAPELFALLATFALTLVAKDAVLWLWGPEDLLGPRAPGLSGSIPIAGARLPEYDVLLILVGPLVLIALWLLLTRTRWGTLVRAATADRQMAGALGVNEAHLFTGVFALGAFLAGLGGALQLPREPAQLSLDIGAVTDAFVVVVVGGLGSIPGAFLAAVLIGEVKALCIAVGQVELFGTTLSVSKLTLVAEFLVMAIVLILRPWGLLGRAHTPPPVADVARQHAAILAPGRIGRLAGLALLATLALAPVAVPTYTLVLLTDIFVFALLAASLHLLLGPSGLVSFGHAAYFGLGAYGAALLLTRAGLPMEIALLAGPLAATVAAFAFGWFCVRLSGVYLAMLTLAFAQIVWSIVFQWDAFTGGSNGIVGVWPADWLAPKGAYYLLALALCAGGFAVLRRLVFSPLGWAMRAARDSPLKAEAIGIDTRSVQRTAFTVAGALAGVAGAVYAFSKGSLSPEVLGIGRSVDTLVMVLLGGLHTLTGPAAGAAALTWLQDVVARNTDYWRAILGLSILALVLAFPEGLMGRVERALRGAGR